jgi:DNA repair protein RecN (Recombination protein N)
MLKTLAIRSFAIIDRLNIEFVAGFNVLTGETGAGKSIIMDALSLLLGGRPGAEMVRTGAERAILDASFDLSNSPDLQAVVQTHGFELEDNTLFVSREVQRNGKSSCRIMGRPAAVAQLREIGEWLVDLHGQHEHQSLLATHRHLDMLDDWGGKAIVPLRGEVSEAYHALQRLKREKEALERDARERAHLLDLYQFQIQEIDAAKLEAGEDEELATEHRRVANAQKLAEAATVAAAALGGGEERGVLDALAFALKTTEEAAELDTTLHPIVEVLRNAAYELGEAERDLIHYQGTLEFEPERLAQIEERLNTLRALKRKYGESVQEVLSYREQVGQKLEGLAHSEERGEVLDAEIACTTKRLREACDTLHTQRRGVADRFQQLTLVELVDLGMEKARFEVLTEPCEPTVKGADKVEFLIATNPGEPLRPLVKIASGGEISRVMLAIKSAMARQEALPTMVFDEIDVGVGGRTASVIADKMATLAQTTQILCITHLAQIASRGVNHFYIEKRLEGERASVVVTPLTQSERILEVARMIGGTEVTETVLQHAREMLRLV